MMRVVVVTCIKYLYFNYLSCVPYANFTTWTEREKERKEKMNAVLFWN